MFGIELNHTKIICYTIVENDMFGIVQNHLSRNLPFFVPLFFRYYGSHVILVNF